MQACWRISLNNFTKGVVNTPEQLINELSYSTYSAHRALGMCVEAARKLWPETGEAMEKRYQEEHNNG
jgi:hypothetical protein